MAHPFDPFFRFVAKPFFCLLFCQPGLAQAAHRPDGPGAAIRWSPEQQRMDIAPAVAFLEDTSGRLPLAEILGRLRIGESRFAEGRFGGFLRVALRHIAIDYANIPSTTSPCTLVSRRWMPLW